MGGGHWHLWFVLERFSRRVVLFKSLLYICKILRKMFVVVWSGENAEKEVAV